MNLWERVVERRMGSDLTFNEQQYGFMPRKKHYSRIVYFDGELQRRSEAATLYVCGPLESLEAHEIKRELLGHVRKRKLSYFGHICRDHGCQITKTIVEGNVEGRRRRERPRKQYIDNINQWIQLTTSQCVRAAEVRSRWKQLVSQAMVADDHT